MWAVLERVTRRSLRPQPGVRTSVFVPRSLLLAFACLALVTAACSKGAPGDVEMKNDLTIGTGTTARVGVPDDGVKPMPGKPVLKPVTLPAPSPTPIPYPNNGRSGVPDDSVKPAPVPTAR